MKTWNTQVILITTLFMLVACSSIHVRETCSNRDAISSFFAQESLTIRDIRITTNECGYEVNLKLADTSDSNRVFQGWMMLSDLEKERREAERRSIIAKEDERREREEDKKGTNQFVNMCVINKSNQGIITKAHILNSARIKQRFPDYQVFSVTCLNLGLNPIYISQPMVIGTNANYIAHTTIYILGNAATVASFISMHKRPVHNRGEARDTLELLRELQSWTMCENTPDEALRHPNANNPEWLSRWIYKEAKTADGWKFQAVFLTDPNVQSYSYYEFDVLCDGSILVKDMIHMANFGGHYK